MSLRRRSVVLAGGASCVAALAALVIATTPGVSAQRLTGAPRWGREARRAFAWFLGQNTLKQSVYDPKTGGCRDGLHSDRANENQGAESTLSFLIALLDMRAADRAGAVRSVPEPSPSSSELSQ